MPSINVMQLMESLQPWDEVLENGVDPPGNFYAGALKQIHDDSASVFPASEYSSPIAKENRWKSTVKSDFIPIELQGDVDRKASKPQSPKREKHIQLPKMDDMFNKWRVPSRLTNDHHSRGGSALADLEDEKIATPKQLPTIEYRASKVPATARSACRPQSQHSAPLQPMSARPDLGRPAAPGSPTMRTKYRDPAKPKSLATKQLLRNYQSHDAQERTASAMLKHATDHEKKLIEAALRSYKNGKSNETKAVDKWLENASPKDKEVAMKFFQSNMVNKSPSAQRKMSSVLRKMNKGEEDPFHASASSNKAYGDDLRYLRLLTPNTRANKWQYQTWHHMPPYVDTDPVWNKTAIYTEPQKIPPRHYTIHPDLG